MKDHADEVSDLDQLRSRYEVLRKLGWDGAHPVYAVRGRDSDRHYAVKVISDPGRRSAKPDALHLWHAHTVRKLEHPRLMGLHAIHHLQGGAVAMAMERRPGRTLAERLDEAGPLDQDEVERILRAIAEALAYLHDRGVAHRGVNPYSVFLDRATGEPRLAHFGIDRRAGCSGDDPGAGAVLRAFAYLAPEQIDRKGAVDGRRVSRRTDLYALGLVGHTMLTGKAPWRENDLPALIARKRTDPPPEPDAARPDVAPILRNAIRRCLESSPRRRWGGAEEFLRGLEPAGEVVEAHPLNEGIRVALQAKDVAAAGLQGFRGRILDPDEGRRALAIPVSLAVLLALGVVRGFDRSAEPAAEGAVGPSPAALESATAGFDDLEFSDSFEILIPGDSMPRLLPDPVSGSAGPHPAVRDTERVPAAPRSRPSGGAPGGSQRFAGDSDGASGFVLLGEAISRRSPEGLLGEPARGAGRGP
jgi:hypothetical protein